MLGATHVALLYRSLGDLDEFLHARVYLTDLFLQFSVRFLYQLFRLEVVVSFFIALLSVLLPQSP